MNPFRKFFRLPALEKLLFAEALFFLYLAKTMLLILPFKTCLRSIDSKKSKEIKPEIEQLKKIKQAFHRANKFAWWKNICLVQSFASSWMLSRRYIKSKFFIGVAYDAQKKIKAHAWLMVDDYEIVPKGGNYIMLSQKG